LVSYFSQVIENALTNTHHTSQLSQTKLARK